MFSLQKYDTIERDRYRTSYRQIFGSRSSHYMDIDNTTAATFTRLYQSHSNELFGFCVSKVREREEALDIVHDAFIKLWQMMSAGTEILNHRALLYTIIRHKIIDGYRSVALQRVFPISDELYDSLTDSSQNIPDSIDVRIILNAINAMPETIREPLLYRYVDGMSISDIAHLLKTNPNTITQRIKRSLGTLRAIVSPKPL